MSLLSVLMEKAAFNSQEKVFHPEGGRALEEAPQGGWHSTKPVLSSRSVCTMLLGTWWDSWGVLCKATSWTRSWWVPSNSSYYSMVLWYTMSLWQGRAMQDSSLFYMNRLCEWILSVFHLKPRQDCYWQVFSISQMTEYESLLWGMWSLQQKRFHRRRFFFNSNSYFNFILLHFSYSLSMHKM